jgi:dimethylargininase
MSTIALTRAVSPLLANCELTHLSREPIDISRAVRQHAAYEQTLESLGATIVRVPPAPELADSVFVEDTAIVLDEIAIVTRPGAISRRAETADVAETLAAYRRVVHLQPPAMLDGGDVLRLGRKIYVGQSSRTNANAIESLRRILQPFDYEVIGSEISGCLHLKSAVTAVGENLILVNPQWLKAPGDARHSSTKDFGDADRIEIDPAEPFAANALRVGANLIYPSHFPRTLDLLRNRGLHVTTVGCDELAKAEGAVTCCSIIFDAPQFHPAPM